MYEIWPKWEKSQAGRPRPGRPAYTPGSLMLIFGQSAHECKYKPIQCGFIQNAQTKTERFEPRMIGSTCSTPTQPQAQNRL